MNLVKHGDIQFTELQVGVKRRILSYTDDIMAVELSIAQDVIGPVHSHPHAQCSFVVSGTFVFTVNGQEFEVSEGDTIAFERNEVHGCICKSSGTLIDIFSPMRKEFLSKI